tara:strand:+ start:26605 stop:28050 length:1446 start_codon:yes stop_codon:yes gene_type:complete
MPRKAVTKLQAKKTRVNMMLLASDFEHEDLTPSKDVQIEHDTDEQTPETFLSRLELKYACNPTSPEELNACENVLSKSMHSVIQLLPNHHIDSNGFLRGFKFECHAEEKATVLPIGKDMFDLISMYECKQPTFDNKMASDVIHPDAMRIFNNLVELKEKLKEFMTDFDVNDVRVGQEDGHSKAKPASFDCIRDEISSTKYTQQVPDKRTWRESKPNRIGLYHAYVRSHKKDAIEHKMFIVVSGYMHIACEELENLWQDSHSHLSCRDFIQSEECHWLRIATLRNHNRVALQLSQMLQLKLETRLDMDDPSGRQYMAMPTTFSFKTDMYVTDNGRSEVVDSGCFLNRGRNGILFEMFESEGYWLFTGPKDYASDSVYGSISERSKHMNCFPTRTITFSANYVVKKYANVVKVCPQQGSGKRIIFNPTASNYEDHMCAHNQESRFYYFPNTEFMQTIEQIGFDRNDSVLHLMPILSCASQFKD